MAGHDVIADKTIENGKEITVLKKTIEDLEYKLKKQKESAEESRKDIRNIRAVNTKINNDLKAMKLIVDKKGVVALIKESSERIKALSEMTQINLTKISVMTEINFLNKKTFKLQKVLIRMFDDKDCNELFLKSRTMNVWENVIINYGKNT